MKRRKDGGNDDDQEDGSSPSLRLPPARRSKRPRHPGDGSPSGDGGGVSTAAAAIAATAGRQAAASSSPVAPAPGAVCRPRRRRSATAAAAAPAPGGVIDLVSSSDEGEGGVATGGRRGSRLPPPPPPPPPPPIACPRRGGAANVAGQNRKDPPEERLRQAVGAVAAADGDRKLPPSAEREAAGDTAAADGSGSSSKNGARGKAGTPPLVTASSSANASSGSSSGDDEQEAEAAAPPTTTDGDEALARKLQERYYRGATSDEEGGDDDDEVEVIDPAMARNKKTPPRLSRFAAAAAASACSSDYEMALDLQRKFQAEDGALAAAAAVTAAGEGAEDGKPRAANLLVADDEMEAKRLQEKLEREDAERARIEAVGEAEARRLQDRFDKEDKEEAERARADADKAMETSATGKAYLFVQDILDLVEGMKKDGTGGISNSASAAAAAAGGGASSTGADGLSSSSSPSSSMIEAVAKDDMVYLAEKLLALQEDFRTKGKPTTVDLGIHYTSSTNLHNIRSDGLLTFAERHSRKIKSTYHGSAYGDGVYTADDVFSSSTYGDIGLIVARLKGIESNKPADAHAAKNAVRAIGRKTSKTGTAAASPPNNHDTFIVAGQNWAVLRESSQCLALVHYRRELITTNPASGAATIASYGKSLQKVCDRYFNEFGPSMSALLASSTVSGASAAPPGTFASSSLFNPLLPGLPPPPAPPAAVGTALGGSGTSMPFLFGALASAPYGLPPHLSVHPSTAAGPPVTALPQASRSRKKKATVASAPSSAHPPPPVPPVIASPRVSRSRKRMATAASVPSSALSTAAGLPVAAAPRASRSRKKTAPPTVASPPSTATGLPVAATPRASRSRKKTAPPIAASVPSRAHLSKSTAAGLPVASAPPRASTSRKKTAPPTVASVPSSPQLRSTAAGLPVAAASSRRSVKAKPGTSSCRGTPETLQYKAPETLSGRGPEKGLFREEKARIGTGMCSICLDDMKTGEKVAALLVCKQHCFHLDCLRSHFNHNGRACPCCRKNAGRPQGKMPSGSMTVIFDPRTMCQGYPPGTIMITYSIGSGIQKSYHTNPGVRHGSALRTAYLPDNDEGRNLLKRLKYAFQSGLTFTVGTSQTTGAPNQITWSSIHHKTSPSGGQRAHGFPDPNFFKNSNAELDNAGVPPADEL